MGPFDAFRHNTYSQNGEDGVLEEILLRLQLPLSSSKSALRWCVEFGAWDGKHLSNTFSLVEKYNWNAIYIEGDEEKFELLKKTSEQNPSITPVLALVDYQKDSQLSLDNILVKYDIPYDFDLLSIDIDSYDLAVWYSLDKFTPKIVVIEINSSYPPGILSWHSKKSQGNSFSSTLNVGIKKGYRLVCHTGNLIFVHEKYASLLGMQDIFYDNPETLFDFSYLPQTKQKKPRKIKMIKSFLLKLFFRTNDL